LKIDDVGLKDGRDGDTGDEVDFSASEMHGPTKNWLSLPQPRLFIPAPFLVNKVFILLARRHKAVL